MGIWKIVFYTQITVLFIKSKMNDKNLGKN